MKKRILALMLSSIMVISGAITALATDGEAFLEAEEDSIEVLADSFETEDFGEVTEDSISDDLSADESSNAETVDEPVVDEGTTEQFSELEEITIMSEDAEELSITSDYELTGSDDELISITLTKDLKAYFDNNNKITVSTQIIPTYNPINYTPKGTIQWDSSDPVTATIDNDGNVTYKNIGSTTITATVDGVTGSIELDNNPTKDMVNVFVDSDHSVHFSWNSINRATSYAIEACDEYNDVRTADIPETGKNTYEYTDTFYRKQPGYYNMAIDYTFCVEINGKWLFLDIPVTLTPQLQLRETSVTDNTVTLELYAPSGTVPTGTVTWKSSDEQTATVDKNGKVTFKDIGETTITATVGDFTASKYYERELPVTITESNGKVTFKWNKSTRALAYSLYRDSGESARIFYSANDKSKYEFTDNYFYQNPPTEEMTATYFIIVTGDFGENLHDPEYYYEVQVRPSSGNGNNDEESDEEDDIWGDIHDEFIKDHFHYSPTSVPSGAWYVIGDTVIASKYDFNGLVYSTTYTGAKITFDHEISVYYGKKKLTNKTDYTITYFHNVSTNYTDSTQPGFTVKCKGKYTGSQTFYFDINKASLESAIIASETVIPIAKGGKKLSSIKVKVNYGSKTLKAGTDYRLEYDGPDGEVEKPSKETLNDPEAEYIIRVVATDKGNFTGEVSQTVSVVVVDPKEVVMASKFSVGDEKRKALKFNYGEITNTTEIDSLFTGEKAFVYYNRQALTCGEDYEVEALESDYSTVGTHLIRIIGSEGGIKNFLGTKTVSFKVLPYNFTKDSDNRLRIEVDDAEYNKKGAKPAVKVYFTEASGEEVLLESGVDYTVSYKNNKKVADESSAKAPTVIIKGKGRYTGSATKKFSIYD